MIIQNQKKKKDADHLVCKILSKTKDWLQNPRYFELKGLMKNDISLYKVPRD